MPVRWASAGWKVLDFFLPPQCGGCDRWGVSWCDSCQAKTEIIPSRICAVCGEPRFKRKGTDDGICDRCRSHQPEYTMVRSWARFSGPVRRAVYRLKYRRDAGLGKALSSYLVQIARDQHWVVNAVTVVPLDDERMRQRGYNQANLLAGPVAKALGVPFRPNALERVRKTQSQVGLSRRERGENVRNAFSVSPDIMLGQQVILVDDVITTGATLRECARALKKAGTKRVYGLTLARSLLE